MNTQNFLNQDSVCYDIERAAAKLGVSTADLKFEIESGTLYTTNVGKSQYITTEALNKYSEKTFGISIDNKKYSELQSQPSEEAIIVWEDESGMNKVYISYIESSGRYMVQVYAGRKENGRRNVISKSFSTREDAEAYAKTAIGQPEAQCGQPDMRDDKHNCYAEYKGVMINKDTPFYDFADYYINVQNGASDGTKSDYLTVIKRLNCLGFFKNISIGGIRKQMVHQAMTTLIESGVVVKGKKKCASTSIIKKTRTLLKMITKFAAEEDIIPTDPLSNLKIYKSKVIPKERRAFSENEQAAMISAVKDDPIMCAYIATIRCTGMRPGEMNALSYKNIDFERKQINVCEAVKFLKRGESGIGLPKTNKSRIVPISDEAVFALKALKQVQESKKVYSERVFVDDEGKMIPKEYIERKWKAVTDRLIKDNGWDANAGYTLYYFRHTALTAMCDGVNSDKVKYVSGHSDTQMLDGTYNHVEERKAVEACRKITDNMKNYLADDSIADDSVTEGNVGA